MKAIWTGAIGFGLVNIPVKLYSATEESNIDLDMLDKKDLSNIKFKRVNEKTGKEVAWENIVKAYNYKGNYIVLNDDDFEKAYPEKSKLLTIDQFVDEKDIDSVYYEAPYFIQPQKNGEEAYTLLKEALKKTKKAGVGTFIMRNKEALGVLKVYEDIMIFQRIRYEEEIRDKSELSIPKKTVKPAELKMATALIEQLSQKFNSKAYKNNYSAQLMKLIKDKAKGKVIAEPKLKVVHSNVTDLMAKLKASLNNSKKTA